MDAPPPYPRIAHLVAGRGTADDVDVDPAAIDALLAGEVVVEEKLDGANVVVWPDGPRLDCALRSGPGSADRARQLGPLRKWVAEHAVALRTLLGDDTALSAEWLLLTHSIAYDRLPAYLVALDLWSPARGFVSVDERNARSAAVGLPTPPELWRGRASSAADLEARLGPSAYGTDMAEGLVVRAVDGRPPPAGQVAPGRLRPHRRRRVAPRTPAQPAGRRGHLMALSNCDRVGRAFELLAAGLGPFVRPTHARARWPGVAHRVRPIGPTAGVGGAVAHRPGAAAAGRRRRLGRSRAEMEITIEVRSTRKDGLPDETVRIVGENATALRFRDHGFEAT